MKPDRRTVLLVCVALALAGATACGTSADGGAAATADAAVAQLAAELAAGRPQALWQALPASYQEDVQELIRAATEKMDAELWNQTFTVLGKATRLLSEKRDFILDNPMLAQQMDNRDDVRANWDHVVGAFNIVTHSELSDLALLQELDVESFLSGTGAKLMDHLRGVGAMAADEDFGQRLQRLADLRASVVSRDDHATTVRIEMPELEPIEERLVQVEGKWVPERLAEHWSLQMADLRRKVREVARNVALPDNHGALLMQLSMLESALDHVLEARTIEEFNAGIGATMGTLLGAAMGPAGQAFGGADTATAGTPDPGPVSTR